MSKKTYKINNEGIALLLACLMAILLTVTAPDIGLTWDEPAYIAASERYMEWFGRLAENPRQAFLPEVIDYYWSINHEHPALDKIWSGGVWSLSRNFFNDLTAHRMGNILLVSLLVGLLYFMVAETYGKAAGLFAVAALLSMPRFFFHAHLAALDMPAAVTVFAVTFVFWRTADRKGWGWGLLLGLVWGLALGFKINAIFVPVTLGLWWLIFNRKWHLLLRFALMGVIGIPVFIGTWPWLYTDTIARLRDYFLWVTTAHWQIGQWYFDSFYMPPPWHFAFVMPLAVVPLTVTLLALGGVARAGKGKQDKGLGWLLVLSALTPLAALATGKSMVYDNERLFMPAFPFAAALAGVGFCWLIEGLRRLAFSLAALGGIGRPWRLADLWKRVEAVRHPRWFAPAGVLLAVILLLPQTVTMAGLYPHLLSYYSESVGGLSGATKLGLETTYWCETYQSAVEYINQHAEPGDTVWVEWWSEDVLVYYQLNGILRKDVRIFAAEGMSSIFGSRARLFPGSYQNATWAIFQYRQTVLGEEGYENELWQWVQEQEPIYRVEFQGVPIMDLIHQ